ncbi:hypothetical protein [Methanospirillum lacunae]|nr:hypothetical protein [Methanospirillum lacunae]
MMGGQFEKGRWVEEPTQQASATGSPDDLTERLSQAKASFGKGLDELLSVGKELLTTQEGRKHIGRSMDQTGAEIMGTLEETARKATEYISSVLEQKRKD